MMSMRSLLTYLFVTFLVFSNILFIIPDSCDSDLGPCEKELSLLETILLFPVSMFPREIPDLEDMLYDHQQHHGTIVTRIMDMRRSIWLLLVRMKTQLYQTSSLYLQWTVDIIYAEYLLEAYYQGDLTFAFIKQGLVDLIWSLSQRLSTFCERIATISWPQTFVLSEILASWHSAIVKTTAHITSLAYLSVIDTIALFVHLRECIINIVKAVYSGMESMFAGSIMAETLHKLLDCGKLYISNHFVTGALAMVIVPLVLKSGLFRGRSISLSGNKKKQSKRSLEVPLQNPLLYKKLGQQNIIQMPEKSTQTSTLFGTFPLPRRGHYAMCEVFDAAECNCGGRDNSSLGKCHFRMCEYYDGEKCNCGGKDEGLGSMTAEMIPNSFHTQDIEAIPKHEEFVIHSLDQDTIDFPKIMKQEQSALHDSYNKLGEEKWLHGDLEHNTQYLASNKEDKSLKRCGHDITISSKNKPEQDNQETGSVSELHLSFDSEFGEPCCNSSFKEDSHLSKHSRFSGQINRTTDALQQSTYSNELSLGGGDGCGSPVIVTRRSPRKEVGISFRSQSVLSDVTSVFESDLSTSLLDVSEINKNLSFNQGDGLVEFTVMFAIQSAYRLTKWFLNRHREASITSDIANDASVDLFVISRKNSSRCETRRNVSFSASNQYQSEYLSDSDTSSEIADLMQEELDYISMSNESVCGSEQQTQNLSSELDESGCDEEFYVNDDFGDAVFDLEMEAVDTTEPLQKVENISPICINIQRNCSCIRDQHLDVGKQSEVL